MIVAGTPCSLAAIATPWAWLPDEKAVTPRARDTLSSADIADQAPRNLKDPVLQAFGLYENPATRDLVEKGRGQQRCASGVPGKASGGGVDQGYIGHGIFRFARVAPL